MLRMNAVSSMESEAEEKAIENEEENFREEELSSYSNTPLSNGAFFLVLSLADWERERSLYLNSQRRFLEDGTEGDEIKAERLGDTLQKCARSLLCLPVKS